MSKVYLISDGYFRDEYPMKTNLDIEKFYGVQAMYIKVQLKDLLGANIHSAIMELAGGATPSACEDKLNQLLSDLQYLMVFYIAKGLEDFNKEEGSDNKVQSIKSNIAYLEKDIRAYILANECLVAIQDSDTEPNRQDYNSLPTYFYK
jgi:hypothetical protein